MMTLRKKWNLINLNEINSNNQAPPIGGAFFDGSVVQMVQLIISYRSGR